MTRKKQNRVKVYLKDPELQAMADDAARAGFRREGLPIFVQKKHGFANEKVLNSDGISKFLKFCYQYWKRNEAERIEKYAELRRKEKELEEEKRRLGLKVG